jgi:hypothetical protein
LRRIGAQRDLDDTSRNDIDVVRSTVAIHAHEAMVRPGNCTRY